MGDISGRATNGSSTTVSDISDVVSLNVVSDVGSLNVVSNFVRTNSDVELNSDVVWKTVDIDNDVVETVENVTRPSAVGSYECVRRE